ncbi:MAG: (2Fe-2S)-binding protein [Gammaproteobacteria bacterium]|nr:MAG: (2Fe-2S)-binding protein [Gammaproteobacteria bacterium]
MIQLNINGSPQQLDIDPDTPLLWAIRDSIGLTGTKFGCGMSQCGACTVHLDGRAVRSCVTPVSAAEEKTVTTIEGLESAVGKAVQAAWEKLDVVQCGYCQSGQIMSAVDLLSRNAQPTDKDIDDAMAGNICRCNTYVRIRAAILHASRALS